MSIIRFFLCGDVMTGRGIDQILPHPCNPMLHEDYVQSALGYVQLAENLNGPIPWPVHPAYVWDVALDEWSAHRPDVRIINLETSITRGEDYLDKAINYRMSPENADCLTAAAINCCALANNHVLDWGRDGLLDTLTTLQRLEIKTAGAGRDLAEASAPAVLPIAGKGRVLVFAFALATSGVPRSWAAKTDMAGVNFLNDLSDVSVDRVCDQIIRMRRASDVVVVSLHWGPNWGYGINDQQKHFSHALIDHAGVSIIHGHSSHHAKAIEVYRDRLILYGCGDFLNDYEGIKDYEEYRSELALMYFVDVDTGHGDLNLLEMVPLQIKQLHLVRPSIEDIDWLRRRLDRESRRFATAVIAAKTSDRLRLVWPVQA